MQKLQEGDRLNLPIEIFLFKRQILWIVLGLLGGSLAGLVAIFNRFTELSSQGHYIKLLAMLMIFCVLIFFSIVLAKSYFSNKPIAQLNRHNFIIFNLNSKRDPIVIDWHEIVKIDAFSHQRGNGLVFYLKNRPPFKDMITLSLYGGAVIEGKLMNTREVEHIFNQFLQYYQNYRKSSNQPIIIKYENVNKKFLDWA